MYRAAAVSQRDGSSLANSNCRMAAGSTVIDHDTLGSTTSTGSAMRSRQSDQSGGTDSGDLAEAWRNYGETLTIRDGRTWADALADLRAGRAIVLDVWHATAGGPCLSGSGAYGHSMAVAPEFHSDGDRILVSDPWCSPARWDWWPLQKLQAGAEVWGDQVYGRATGGRTVASVVRELMTRWRPGYDATPWDVLDTGGAGRILYSASDAHPEVEPVTIQFDVLEAFAGTVEIHDDEPHSYLDLTTGDLHELAGTKEAYARIRVAKGTVLGDADERRTGYLIGTSAAMLLEVDVDPHPASGGGGSGEDGETIEEAYGRGRVDEYQAWYDALGLPEPPEA